MSEHTYRIHELAALASVTVKALHHYDRVGLLKPRRTASRYRLYTTRDLTRLQQILALRSLGLPLRRIRDLLAPGTPPLHLALRQQRQVLQDQRRLLDRTIRALETAEASLAASPDCAADALRALLEGTALPDSVVELTPQMFRRLDNPSRLAPYVVKDRTTRRDPFDRSEAELGPRTVSSNLDLARTENDA